VTLITDSTSAIPSEVSGKNVIGITKGVIGNGLQLDQVPQSEEVLKDDLIITSGLGGELPKGIILAKVGEIQKVSGSIFQQIELLPMVDFAKISKVMIAK
jgi:rod shape-determining protein MreC